ncbi:hypothetical protein [Pacificibacter marinus]|uniref:hypothetical protein n=1 Tax=Pacificibacter marinus TaxID=658057 RepID=UPI001C070834|nr:hypothetical protein [Pacificibacter marinus]MBU2867131.1 hypothetical protein [Pacificibacter marinus]
MNVYQEWGFKQNPFETLALPANKTGVRLLVGREKELKKLSQRLDSSTKIATVEGLNGVGKTSLVNVLLYKRFSETANTNIGPLYIPCDTQFQITGATDPEDFKQKVLLAVAQSLLNCHGSLRAAPGMTKPMEQTALKRFLNSPQISQISAGIAALSAGFGQETNTGFGYEHSGFEKTVRSWLLELFPTSTSGGVVCTLDNLELLQTSDHARKVVEELRDTVFAIQGIRWVLCGSLGIVHGILGSPRLEGRLHKPISVEDLSDDFAAEIYQNRVKNFRTRLTAKLPLTQSNFIELFDIMRGNIRSVLNEADEFCIWFADNSEDIEDFKDETHFEQWLEEELTNTYTAVQTEIRPRAMEVFETACQFEVFSPSDCMSFGFETPSAMRPHIKSLEATGLLRSAIDDTDKRRKTIQVTSKGWKIRAYLDFFDPIDEF